MVAMTSFSPPMPVSLARHHLDPPALALGELAVHAEQLGGEQRRFVAAGAGADLEHDVLLVVRVLRDEQDLEVGDQRVAARDERLQLLLRQLAHVRVAARRELLGLRDVARDVLVLAEALDGRLDLRQRLGVLPVLGWIALHLGRAERGRAAPRIAVRSPPVYQTYSRGTAPHPLGVAITRRTPAAGRRPRRRRRRAASIRA